MNPFDVFGHAVELLGIAMIALGIARVMRNRVRDED
jgi:hypothetical protein